MDTRSTAPIAVTLMAHCGIESGDTSDAVVWKNILFKYSAKMRLITALEPGLRVIDPQVKRYDMRGPYA